MANRDHQSLSSAFDDMLKDTWREFDGLYGASQSSPASVGSPSPAPQRPPPARSASLSSRSTVSNAERFLNDRYGDGWSQEILEQRRDGDEVIALCKLVIEDQGISKTQFGRARVAGGGGGKVAGSAGGVSFSLAGQSDDGRRVGADAEAAAYREAAQDALAKCVALL